MGTDLVSKKSLCFQFGSKSYEPGFKPFDQNCKNKPIYNVLSVVHIFKI